MVNLLKRTERWREMYDHLVLVWTIQADYGNSQRIEQVYQRVLAFRRNHPEVILRNSEEHTDPPPVSVALRPCRSTWQKTIENAHPRQRGQVISLNEEKRYGFIQDQEGKRIHFNFRAFRGQPELGIQVEFQLEESFDRKRNEQSVSAVQIRPLRIIA